MQFQKVFTSKFALIMTHMLNNVLLWSSLHTQPHPDQRVIALSSCQCLLTDWGSFSCYWLLGWKPAQQSTMLAFPGCEEKAPQEGRRAESPWSEELCATVLKTDGKAWNATRDSKTSSLLRAKGSKHSLFPRSHSNEKFKWDSIQDGVGRWLNL